MVEDHHTWAHTLSLAFVFFLAGRMQWGNVGEQLSLVLPLRLLKGKEHNIRKMPFLSIGVVCLTPSRLWNEEAGRVKY